MPSKIPSTSPQYYTYSPKSQKVPNPTLPISRTNGINPFMKNRTHHTHKHITHPNYPRYKLSPTGNFS